MTSSSRPRRARILAIHRYYWPDTPPYASLLRSIVRSWTDAGHEVEVLSSQPSYKPELDIPKRATKERIDDALVRRISLRPDRSSVVRRVWNAVWFPLTVAMRILVGRRYDVVMCSTAPPVSLGWATSLAARLRGARFVYHCMDIHPEIGALSGEFRVRPLYALLRAIDKATCRRAAAVVVLSEDMLEAMADRDPAVRERLVVINNFDLPDHNDPCSEFSSDTVESPLPAGNRTRLVFTGNIGRFQGLEDLTRALLEPTSDFDELELVLMGEGSAKAGLQQMVSAADATVRDRVALLPHGSAAEARALVSTADIGVVSLTPGIIRYAFPSKTATYLSEGAPILALVETDSELACRVIEGGYGFAVAPGDGEGLASVLAHIASTDSVEAKERRLAAHAAWEAEFSSGVVLPRWDALMIGLLGEDVA